jgi:Ni,Fe-hydrogenase maturation factor|tara:strand:- start:291 stop:419 length:129 start_codon:yes stop_codon:yes gene_type:complete
MKADEVLKKVKEYLKDNKEVESLDIQSDSENLLFWIKNWEAQ